ncbi:MAG TPA: hypothetical protein VIL20_28445 [Sandaracinaceae bacterium]
MPLSDSQWRFVVEELLGADAERCEAIAERIAARYPDEARAGALARALFASAIITGVPSGFAATLPRALGLALIEQRATLRRAVMLRACIERLDDPRFFEREEWARRALLGERTGPRFAARVAGRFVLRFSLLRGTRRATRVFGRRLSSLAGATAGALFDGIEHARLAASVRREREARLRRREPERGGRVIPLPVPARAGHDGGHDPRTRKP